MTALEMMRGCLCVSWCVPWLLLCAGSNRGPKRTRPHEQALCPRLLRAPCVCVCRVKATSEAT